MQGRKQLTETLYLIELNATLDEIACGYNVKLPHFKQLPKLSESIGPAELNGSHARLYLQAEQIMQRHFKLTAG